MPAVLHPISDAHDAFGIRVYGFDEMIPGHAMECDPVLCKETHAFGKGRALCIVLDLVPKYLGKRVIDGGGLNKMLC